MYVKGDGFLPVLVTVKVTVPSSLREKPDTESFVFDCATVGLSHGPADRDGQSAGAVRYLS